MAVRATCGFINGAGAIGRGVILPYYLPLMDTLILDTWEHLIRRVPNASISAADLAVQMEATVSEFNALTFPPGFGFDSYSHREVLDNFLADNRFNLSLNKVRGRGILYGISHVTARRRLFNLLPVSIRRAIVIPKLIHFGIDHFISDFFGMRSHVPIDDVVDIGMGHSVFHVVTPFGGIVVKQESVPNQQFYVELLRILGYPWFRSRHFVGDRSWEITEYLGPENLNDRLVNRSIGDWDRVIDQLARHAAIGDVLGREDRHFENYICVGDAILPVDTAMLFGRGNEQWGSKYIAGGLYEICILQQWIGDDKLRQIKLDQFRTAYLDQLNQLRIRRHDIITMMREFFSQSMLSADNFAYVETRLTDLDYGAKQLRRYRDGLAEMARRFDIRTAIAAAYDNDPNSVWNEPFLKMYYLADQARWSTLFLLEEHQAEVETALARQRIVVHHKCGAAIGSKFNSLDWGID